MFSEHLEHLEYVSSKLQNGGLTINWEKSMFLQTEIHFLCFIITPEGILANPDKVEAIMSFPEPVSYTHLDVYKRQPVTPLPLFLEWETSSRSPILRSVFQQHKS